MRTSYRFSLLALIVISWFETNAATTSTVTLTSTPNPSTYGSVVALKATVPAGATGAVTFYDGAAVLGTARVVGAAATLSTVLPGTGNRRLTAYYGGDSTFAASTSTVLLQTVQAVGANLLAGASYPSSVPTTQNGLATADFNGDGRSDLVWSGLAGAGIAMGNGDGSFQPSRMIANGVGLPTAHSLAIADFNGDGNLDIAVGQQFPLNVAILRGNGDGTFQAGVTLNVSTYAQAVTAGDFNGDGNVDLIVVEATHASFYAGTGDGNFLPPVVCATGSFLIQVAVGDFNGDGKTDLALVDSVVDGAGGVKVLLGNGNGAFQAPVLFNASLASAVLAADFDQDGVDDLAIVAGNGIEIIMGARVGAMRSTGWTVVPDYPNALLVKGDFNGDGKIDLAMRLQAGTVLVMPGDGAGHFGTGVSYPLLQSQYPSSIVEGEFNGDGRADLATVDGTVGLTILRGVSATMSASGTPQTTLLGRAFPNLLAATILDSLGNPVSGATVLFTSGTSGASATLSSAAAVTDNLGIASVSATANSTAGAYAVVAAAGPLTAQFNLTNVADSAATLTALSGTPQTVSSGMPFPVPLNAILKNSSGQPVSGATISYSAPAGIGLSASVASTDSSGVARVWATAGNQPATYSVTASNGSLSATFSLTVAAPVSVSLAASPNPSRYGQSVTLTASVPSGVTGSVTFYDGLTIIGSATISSQAAAVSTILLPSGVRNLRARYNGDSAHPASRSASLAQTVHAVSNSAFSFGPASAIGGTYAVGRGPSRGVIADFNGDGIADVAVANSISPDFGSVSVLLGNGDGSFRSGISSSFSGEASPIASADFNGDGKPDLAVGVTGGLVRVLLGNGDGSMTIVGSYDIVSPSSIVVTDLNRDGRADLVVLDSPFGSPGSLKVLLGNGDGTFQSAVSYDAGGQYASSLVLADLNGDGVPDFALTHSGFTSSVTVLLANPDGTLQAARECPTAIYAYNVATGDLNGDGKADFVVLGSSSWSVMLGNGDGTFQQSGIAGYSTWTTSPFVIADINGDGKADVALTYGNSGSQGVLLVLGNGDGTLQAPITFPGASSLTLVGAADFTGEGKADIALLDLNNKSVEVLRDQLATLQVASTHDSSIWQGLIGAGYVLTVTNNQPAATTGAVKVTDTLPSGLTATGIAGSGWSCDLGSLSCSRSDSLAPGGSYPPIYLIFDVPSNAPAQVTNSVTVSVSGVVVGSTSDPTAIAGSLRPTTTTLTVSPSPANLGQAVTLTAHAAGPLGGLVVFYDGASILGSSLLDNSQSAAITTNSLAAGTHQLRAWFRGNGVDAPSTSPTVSLTARAAASQGFSPLGGYTVSGNAYWIAPGDFNGDGKTDLAIANGSGVSVLLGSGNATFQPPVDYTANKGARFIAAGDFNRDGKTDLVTANPTTNDVTVFLANADGTFQAGLSYPVGTTPYSLAIADVNGDGNLDVAVPNYASGNLTILLGNGDGTFRQFVSYPVGNGAYSVAIGDFNGDSKPDVAVTTSSGFVNVLIANGSGIFQAPAALAVGGTPFGIAAADFNGDGKLDLVVTGSSNVSVLIGNGDGTFRAPIMYAAGASPVALATGDFNGDGNLDVAVANGAGGGASVLFGNGDGSFRAPTVYAGGSSATSLAVGDFNGDGKADLAVTTGSTAFTTSASVSGATLRAVTSAAATNLLIFQGADLTSAVTPASGTGATQTFTATYSAAKGYTDLQWVQMLFATATDGGGQSFCFVHYDVVGNRFWLYGDGGFFVGPVAPGSASNVLQNSLCALNTSGSSVSGSGNTLTVNANIVFKQNGARNVYLRAMTLEQVDTGWVQRGSWTGVAANQATLSVNPPSGSGSTFTFTATYPDTPGFAGAAFGWAQFLIAAASDGGGQPFCFVHYDRGGNGLWMYSSDVGFFLGPVAPGTASTALSSSACSVNTASATVTNSGGNLVVAIPITMKAPMAGAKKIYQRTLDTLNRDTGWQQTGSWTVQ